MGKELGSDKFESGGGVDLGEGDEFALASETAVVDLAFDDGGVGFVKLVADGVEDKNEN